MGYVQNLSDQNGNSCTSKLQRIDFPIEFPPCNVNESRFNHQVGENFHQAQPYQI